MFMNCILLPTWTDLTIVRIIINDNYKRLLLFRSLCELTYWYVNIGSVNGLVPSVKKWLGAIKKEAITFTTVDPNLCRHKASIGGGKKLIQKLMISGPTIYFVSLIHNTKYMGHRTVLETSTAG